MWIDWIKYKKIDKIFGVILIVPRVIVEYRQWKVLGRDKQKFAAGQLSHIGCLRQLEHSLSTGTLHMGRYLPSIL